MESGKPVGSKTFCFCHWSKSSVSQHAGYEGLEEGHVCFEGFRSRSNVRKNIIIYCNPLWLITYWFQIEGFMVISYALFADIQSLTPKLICVYIDPWVWICSRSFYFTALLLTLSICYIQVNLSQSTDAEHADSLLLARTLKSVAATASRLVHNIIKCQYLACSLC